MTGAPEGSTESGFMEKPGIEPATPGLQGRALIHYTTGASRYLACSIKPLPSLFKLSLGGSFEYTQHIPDQKRNAAM